MTQKRCYQSDYDKTWYKLCFNILASHWVPLIPKNYYIKTEFNCATRSLDTTTDTTVLNANNNISNVRFPAVSSYPVIVVYPYVVIVGTDSQNYLEPLL